MFWPGPYSRRKQKMLEPIGDQVPIMKIDAGEEPDVKVKTVGGNLYLHTSGNLIASTNGIVRMEDIGAGETVSFTFPYDEFRWILAGKAEMTYSLAGTAHTDLKSLSLEPGNICLCPLGARVTWKVSPEAPLRQVCVRMPGTGMAEVRADSFEALKQ